jgi:hypothetical protein
MGTGVCHKRTKTKSKNFLPDLVEGAFTNSIEKTIYDSMRTMNRKITKD